MTVKSNLINNKVCLVTGAGKGIGRAIVKAFVREGAIVYANSLNENEMENLKEECNKIYGVKIVTLPFDITD